MKKNFDLFRDILEDITGGTPVAAQLLANTTEDAEVRALAQAAADFGKLSREVRDVLKEHS